MKQLFVNNAKTTLAGTILSTDMSITVPNGMGALFPNPVSGQEYFLVTLELAGVIEIVRCTSKIMGGVGVVDTLVLDTRGMEGTTAAGFSVGASVECRTTAATLSSFSKSTDKLLNLNNVSQLTSPVTMGVDSAICLLGDEVGNPTIAVKKSSTSWAFSTHSTVVVSGTATAGTNNSYILTSTALGSLITSNTTGKYIVQFTSGPSTGMARVVTGFSSNMVTWTEPLSTGIVSGVDQFTLYKSDASMMAATTPLGLVSNGFTSAASTNTLTSADFGRAIYYNQAGVGNITLPAIGAAPVGSLIAISDTGATNCVVTRAGTSTISAFGLTAQTSVTLKPGDSLVLMTDGTNWMQVAGTNLIKSYVDGLGIAASGVQAYLTTNTIAATAVGKVTYFDSAVAGTLTLPAIPAAGKSITVSNLNIGACTLISGGTSLFYARGAYGVTSLVLNLGDSMQFVSDSTDWYQVSSSRHSAALTYVANTFTKPQLSSILALSSGVAWDGTDKQHLTVNVNGSNFTIANPSAQTAGIYYVVHVTYTTGHTLAFGNLFKGIADVFPTATAGAKDHFSFRSDGTNLQLVGSSYNIGA